MKSHLLMMKFGDLRRFDKIAFHKQLQGNGIKTVSDFLERYEQDGQKLRIELGIKPKAWDAILKHAKKCVSVDISSQPVDSPHGAVQPLSTDQPAELPQETLQRPSVPPLDKTLLGNAIPDTSSPNVASAASEHHDPGSLMYTEGTSVIEEKFEGASTFSQCFEAYGPRPSDDYAHRQLVSATNGRQLPMQQEVVCSQDVVLSQGIAVPMLNTIPDCIGRESNCQNGQANHFLDGTIEENQITQSNVVSNSRCGTQIEPPSHTSIQNHLPSSAFFGSHDQRVPLTCDNVSTVFQERFHEPPPPTDHEEGYAAQGPTTYEDLFGVEDMIWFEEDVMMIMNYIQGGDHSSQQELDPLPPGAGYNIGGNNAVYWATKVFLFLRKLSRPKKRRRIQF
ncbi:hypothetical protein KP509_31G030000 [Ceratopteris richardii]|uniref:Calmodulin binding protein central domain-containing protein n=1 Tax=Ceratopteris richardii TaxID=49495 RepID=A0A8T2QY27_CERRI|nr:hypothetical protein KP509_31G030000 [Ceratopteris richardii]